MSDNKKVRNTVVDTSREYQGKKLFSIFTIDDESKRKAEYPVISFGPAKAKAILTHIDELKAYVEKNG